jgi:three-Cys-motif partner protein
MANEDFFTISKEQSRVKSAIVSEYFWSWAKVILSTVKTRPNGRIAYIDLFAGPGRYEDGTKSTPLLVLQQAIDDEDMCKHLVTIFNDANVDNTRELENAINKLEGLKKLKYQPAIYNNEVGDKIVKMFEDMSLVPTLFFVDPWGYKGLSLRLINSVLRNWGCDCIFFFNYNRINMGLGNEFVEPHMDALFGRESNQLETKTIQYSPSRPRSYYCRRNSTSTERNGR